MTPLVSVIIPSYNHGKYIADAINSVLNQSYSNFEIIITDDGSTDNSVEEIKRFNDQRIRLFVFEENRGACVAVNNCIKNSGGEFIAMLSSDDIFLPDKLEKQIDFMKKNPDTGAVFGYPEFINETGSLFEDAHKDSDVFFVKNRTRHEWLNYLFNHGNCLCHPTALIRRKCYEQVGLYDIRLAQLPDYDMWIRLCRQFEIHILPEVLIRFRIRDNNANASAPRPEVIVRDMWERGEVLNHYSDLTADDFFSVFGITTDNVKYTLGQLACNNQSPAYQRFGLQLLHDISKADETKSREFATLSGKLDIHNILDNTYDKTDDACNNNLRISTVLHLYYPDLWKEFCTALKRLPEGTILTVTGPPGSLDIARPEILSAFPDARLCPTQNRGRDIAPFISILPEVLSGKPDLILKLHSKKSTHINDGDLWRQNLLSQLIPETDFYAKITERFITDNTLGILVPADNLLHSEIYSEANEARIAELSACMNIIPPANGWLFPAGSMFWCRPAAIEPVLDINLAQDDFEEEAGQTEGTLAHAMERVFPLAAIKAKMTVAGISTNESDTIKIPFAKKTSDLLKEEIDRLKHDKQLLEAMALERLEKLHFIEKLLAETQAGLKTAEQLAFDREKLLATPGVNIWIAVWKKMLSVFNRG